MSGWQPISTAPKDGTVIDLWVQWPEHNDARRTPDAHWSCAVGEWQLGQYHAGQFVHRPMITHWMPEPAPPSAHDPHVPQAIREGTETLAQLPSLIMENIEAVPNWYDSAALITAHAHAYVLHYDLPEALSPTPAERSGGVPEGFVLMPVEPTPEMLKAAETALSDWRKTLSRDEAMMRSYQHHDRKFIASATPAEKFAIRYRAMRDARPGVEGASVAESAAGSPSDDTAGDALRKSEGREYRNPRNVAMDQGYGSPTPVKSDSAEGR